MALEEILGYTKHQQGISNLVSVRSSISHSTDTVERIPLRQLCQSSGHQSKFKKSTGITCFSNGENCYRLSTSIRQMMRTSPLERQQIAAIKTGWGILRNSSESVIGFVELNLVTSHDATWQKCRKGPQLPLPAVVLDNVPKSTRRFVLHAQLPLFCWHFSANLAVRGICNAFGV